MVTRGASSDTRMTEGGARPASWQTCTIAEIVQQTPSIKGFFLRLSKPFAHIAGQHVDVRLTAPDGYVALRSYSIASSQSASNFLALAVERLPEARKSVVLGKGVDVRVRFGGCGVIQKKQTYTFY